MLLPSKRKYIVHLGIAIVSFLILHGTLFISQPVNFPERKVFLGYPIHFYTLDFGSGGNMAAAPEQFLRSTEFNILSSWEQSVETSLINKIGSFLIIFLITEVVYLLVYYMKSKKGKK